MKENLKKLGLFLLTFLYVGGFICILVAAFGFFKSFVPIVASFIVLGYSIPTAIKLVKELIAGDITFE